MPTTLKRATELYVHAKNLSAGTRAEYLVTLRKWGRWSGRTPIERLSRAHIREFLDHMHEQAVAEGGRNPGRTANKVRENLRAVLSWAWEQDFIESLPQFPRPKPQRDVSGRHYLTKSELNALYFATYSMKSPKGWREAVPVGRYWRCALVLFFNYGFDTGTIWRVVPANEPILWRHVTWDALPTDGQAKERCRWGWIYYRRVKTGKAFYRPMNQAVHAHLKSIMPQQPDPNRPVLQGGGVRPNARFQELCRLARTQSKIDVETGEQRPWHLKDLRKTCATYYDAHMPESSIEILGHSVSGVTYKHYAHRDPLAFKAIMTIPQPASFMGLQHGFDGQCPCCRRVFQENS
ncbi:tyrosine-type recombinase/integrase [Planctomicrobium piriforme]|uniref:Phage integrase, N-terminal SAM-like domain n=1 Tax=Planctomicrobium piriforme TaxID=1576369 RepID=A0A1I3R7N6_9PLAN|nr:site-specific integrase [Planctomicrobium piriforme]SFJ42125.1 Phage integrase, N-terminal SAM-like domain [Planctomicrobium piriforme]